MFAVTIGPGNGSNEVSIITAEDSKSRENTKNNTKNKQANKSKTKSTGVAMMNTNFYINLLHVECFKALFS